MPAGILVITPPAFSFKEKLFVFWIRLKYTFYILFYEFKKKSCKIQNKNNLILLPKENHWQENIFLNCSVYIG